jgi:hypothetical protein
VLARLMLILALVLPANVWRSVCAAAELGLCAPGTTTTAAAHASSCCDDQGSVERVACPCCTLTCDEGEPGEDRHGCDCKSEAEPRQPSTAPTDPVTRHVIEPMIAAPTPAFDALHEARRVDAPRPAAPSRPPNDVALARVCVWRT